MKITLLANYENTFRYSMLRFSDLLTHLLTDAGYAVQVIHPRRVFGNLNTTHPGIFKWLSYIDRFVLFPLTLRRAIQDADIVHICDHSNAMYIPHVRHKPHIITCHDLLAIRSGLGLVPENPTGPSGRILQRWIASNLQNAPSIVCISEQTRRELVATLQPQARHITVIPVSLQPHYYPASAQEIATRLPALGLEHTPYFLHVGHNQWYKNRLGALEIFHALRHKPAYNRHHLAMAGGALTPELEERIQSLQLQDRVHALVQVPDEDLRVLYSRAEALLFPSLAEGFGWPPIEAQACACPTAISDLPPLNELTPRNAAIFINPQEVHESAERIATGLQNHAALVEAGLQNAIRYNQKSMTEAYLSAYRQAIESFKL